MVSIFDNRREGGRKGERGRETVSHTNEHTTRHGVERQIDPRPAISRAVDGSSVRGALQDHVRPQRLSNLEAGVEEGGEEEEGQDEEEGTVAVVLRGHGDAGQRKEGGRGCPCCEGLGVSGDKPCLLCGVVMGEGAKGDENEASLHKICLASPTCTQHTQSHSKCNKPEGMMPIFQCVGLALLACGGGGGWLHRDFPRRTRHHFLGLPPRPKTTPWNDKGTFTAPLHISKRSASLCHPP